MHYLFVLLLLKRLYRFYCLESGRREKKGAFFDGPSDDTNGAIEPPSIVSVLPTCSANPIYPKFLFLFAVHIPRGLSHLASATQKLTLVASGAARCHFTSKRRLVLAVDIPPPRRGLLIGAKRPREGELPALVACAT